jgi:hypothetical protein
MSGLTLAKKCRSVWNSPSVGVPDTSRTHSDKDFKAGYGYPDSDVGLHIEQ